MLAHSLFSKSSSSFSYVYLVTRAARYFVHLAEVSGMCWSLLLDKVAYFLSRRGRDLYGASHYGLQVVGHVGVGNDQTLWSLLWVLLRSTADVLCLSPELKQHASWIFEALEDIDDVVDFVFQETWAAYSQCSKEETDDHAFFRLPVVGGEIVNEVIFICGFSIYREQWIVRPSMNYGVEEW